MRYSFLKNNLKKILKERKITHEQLVNLMCNNGHNITLGAVRKWMQHKNPIRPTIENIEAICTALDIPFYDLVQQDIFIANNENTTKNAVENIDNPTDYMLQKKQPDTIYVPFFKDGLVSAGKGIINFDNGEYDYLPFKENDLRIMFNVNPKAKLAIIPCAGNSMEPTIKEGDLIVFQQDFSQIEGAVYVCRYDDELFVKRLRKRPTIALISDNKDYDPIEIQEAEEIEILGRVVGCYSIISKRI